MDEKFKELVDFLARVPAVRLNESQTRGISCGENDGTWYVMFKIDHNHSRAWHTVQRFAHILNFYSVDEQLPTEFKPYSPPPYLNGGPELYLSWEIVCPVSFPPSAVKSWLESTLPQPVDDLKEWVDYSLEEWDDERSCYRLLDDSDDAE